MHSLEKLKEALGNGAVVAVPMPAHADHQTMRFLEGLPVMAAVLASLIGMNDHRRLGIAPPDRHQQSIDRQL